MLRGRGCVHGEALRREGDEAEVLTPLPSPRELAPAGLAPVERPRFGVLAVSAAPATVLRLSEGVGRR
jgi:hypothetical protein